MKSFSDYLNDFKQLKGLETDKELAEYFHVSQNYMSQARRNGNFTDERCVEIARALKVEEYLVLISKNVLKESGEMREVWQQAAKRLGGILAIGAITIGASRMTADNQETTGFTEAPQLFITGNMRVNAK